MLLFTGKGGAGTTTLAAATAAHTARRGRKTLVLSVDRAHSLADTLGVPLDAEPAEVSIGLYAARVDIRRRLERAWPPLRGLLAELAPLDGELSVSADALAMLPAVEQVLALLQVRDHAASGLWDTVVLDCAPVVDTLRLLALPTTLPWYLGRLLPAHRPGRSSRSLRSLDQVGDDVRQGGYASGLHYAGRRMLSIAAYRGRTSHGNQWGARRRRRTRTARRGLHRARRCEAQVLPHGRLTPS